MSAVLQLLGISKSFPGVAALQAVDLTLQAGSIHALVGENGAGKSTLINILSGVLAPDTGQVLLAGQPVRFADARAARRHGIVTVHQEVDLFPDLTVAENIGLEQGLPTRWLGAIDWRRLHQQTRSAIQAVGEELAPDVLASTLTPGQRQLVEIAAAVAPVSDTTTRVLILDEPTSSLSEAETQVLFDHLRRFRSQGAALLYVSHRLEEIFALADEVTVLRDGRRVWTGPIADSSPRHLIGQMVGREVEPAAAQGPKQTGPVRFRCDGLTAGDGSFADVTLEVRAGETLGLYGLIGAGRSEWAQAVFGLRPLAGGTLQVDDRTVVPRNPGQMVRQGLAYVPEDRLRQGLCRGLSIRANVVLAALRQLAWGLWLPGAREVRRTRSTVEQLAVRLRSIEQPVGTLSGGNQQKVVLGRWLGCDPAVLILDEPTRGVDVGAKTEIHALVRRLAGAGRAVVFISSDLTEVLAQSDRVAVFREGRLAATVDPRTASAEEVAALALPAEKTPTRSVSEGRKYPSLTLRVGVFVREGALLLIVLALFGALHWKTGRYLTAGNLQNLATDAALLSFCAIAAALVLLAGGLDISLGALMALSAGVAGRLWERGQPLPVVAVVAILLGGAGGLLNAVLTLLGRVHPIVVTLGTLSLYRGLTLWWIEQDVQVAGTARDWIIADILGVPLIAWAGLGLVLLTWLVLNTLVAGREIYALGSNPAAAHRVGIERGRVWVRVFTVQGMLAGLAGLLYLARAGSLQPTSFEDKTLEAIAAAVVGGIAITGGRGSVWGVVLGCLFLVMLPSACVFLRVPPHWQRTLVGGVMVTAVVVDTLGRRRTT